MNVLEARHGYLPSSWDVLWSLSVEETFYFFVPLLSRFLGGQKRLFVVILLTFIVLGPVSRAEFAPSNEIWYEYAYLGGMDAIALECITRTDPLCCPAQTTPHPVGRTDRNCAGRVFAGISPLPGSRTYRLS